MKHNYRSKNELKISDEFLENQLFSKDNLEVDAEFSNVNLNILNEHKDNISRLC